MIRYRYAQEVQPPHMRIADFSVDRQIDFFD
jgi:hypothetical protein